jgi:hypothetical protein
MELEFKMVQIKSNRVNTKLKVRVGNNAKW